MQRVYTDEDFAMAERQKKNILTVFWIVLAVYAAVCAVSLAYFISLPYKDEMQTLPKAVVFVCTAVLIVFLFLYVGIKYRRASKYYKMIYFLSEGMKNVEENIFVGFEYNDLQKDGVDAVSCVFKTWNAKKKEWMRREAYWDAEKSFPPFDRGDRVKYIVQSNFIVAYEVIEHVSEPFEEIDAAAIPVTLPLAHEEYPVASGKDE